MPVISLQLSLTNATSHLTPTTSPNRFTTFMILATKFSGVLRFQSVAKVLDETGVGVWTITLLAYLQSLLIDLTMTSTPPLASRITGQHSQCLPSRIGGGGNQLCFLVLELSSSGSMAQKICSKRHGRKSGTLLPFHVEPSRTRSLIPSVGQM